MDMTYRRLGRSGLKVSVLSFGSWVSFGPQLDAGRARAGRGAGWTGGGERLAPAATVVKAALESGLLVLSTMM